MSAAIKLDDPSAFCHLVVIHLPHLTRWAQPRFATVKRWAGAFTSPTYRQLLPTRIPLLAHILK